MICVVFLLVTKLDGLKLTISEDRKMTKIVTPKATFILLPSVLVYGVHSAHLLYLYSNSNMAHNTRPVFTFIMLPPHGLFCIKSDLYVTLDYMFILVLLIGVNLSRTLHHKCNVTTINDLDIFITHHYRCSYTCHYISSFLHRKHDIFLSTYLFNLYLHMSEILDSKCDQINFNEVVEQI